MLTVSINTLRLQGEMTFQSGITAVVGLSGAGKTSLFRMLAGLDQPQQHHIAFRGESLDAQPPYTRPIRYVPQRPSLVPHRTVGSQTEWVRRVEPQVVDDWKHILALDDLWNRLPKALSGGEQQRAALIRALASDPLVLVLDEALSAIDRPHRAAIWEALKDRWPNDRLLIFSTHDWIEAESWADHIAYVEHGRLFGPQATSAIVPQTAEMARLMGFIGAVHLEPHQWLWLHPDAIRPGMRSDAPVNVPGDLEMQPLSRLRARYRLTTRDRVWHWNGPLAENPNTDGIAVIRPVITAFGEEGSRS
ncbi:ATP-binding cassette domain-containing protein [Sulfobacillus harzensis]|uniref:ATP-binding cassette domain-containing protein n=1 Tax=Sulfobacillus harzensis TaxID=2729629 RepID=A0A7Y0Q132_9FIRM|nr:ATP-binding cassette domain-containing protein [Sulfobacillus harzensis]NMP21678.1 ATP-binding cassette domain-containing protein [Sulfobacillus harzensis]